MYRNNMSQKISPRDWIDPRLLERIALRSEMPSNVSEACTCGRSGSCNRSCGCENAAERITENNGCGCNRRTDENARRNNGCGCGCPNQMPRREENENSCETPCETHNAEFDFSLAMVYSPSQEFQNLYCEEEALMTGTIFRELDKHFYGPKCHGGNCND